MHEHWIKQGNFMHFIRDNSTLHNIMLPLAKHGISKMHGRTKKKHTIGNYVVCSLPPLVSSSRSLLSVERKQIIIHSLHVLRLFAWYFFLTGGRPSQCPNSLKWVWLVEQLAEININSASLHSNMASAWTGPEGVGFPMEGPAIGLTRESIFHESLR